MSKVIYGMAVTFMLMPLFWIMEWPLGWTLIPGFIVHVWAILFIEGHIKKEDYNET